MRQQKNKNKFQTGFTLVEMIVAVALFSIVMVIAMGALLNVLNASQQSQSIQTAVNNLNLAMEMMTREIRTGYDYHCGSEGTYTSPKDCLTGENFIAFEPFDGNPASPNDQVVFKYENKQIWKSTDGGVTFATLTSPELHLERLLFIVVGSENVDIHPKVLIVVGGYAGDENREKGRSYFNLQTTISQRKIEFNI
ncbi:MAG: type II secretion system protein [Patescibacteria group bacterium]